MVYICLYLSTVFNKHQPNVGKCTIHVYMDGMGNPNINKNSTNDEQFASENRPSKKESSLTATIFQGLCYFQGV